MAVPPPRPVAPRPSDRTRKTGPLRSARPPPPPRLHKLNLRQKRRLDVVANLSSMRPQQCGRRRIAVASGSVSRIQRHHVARVSSQKRPLGGGSDDPEEDGRRLHVLSAEEETQRCTNTPPVLRSHVLRIKRCKCYWQSSPQISQGMAA